MDSGHFLHRICDVVSRGLLDDSIDGAFPDYGALAVEAHNMTMAAHKALSEAALHAAVDRIRENSSETVAEFVEVINDIHSIHNAVPQAAPHMTFHDVGEPVGDMVAYHDKTLELMDDDEITLEILKLSLLPNKRAWESLRRVFLEHGCPEKLDVTGRRIRSILLSLDSGEINGESQTKEIKETP